MLVKKNEIKEWSIADSNPDSLPNHTPFQPLDQVTCLSI